MESQWWTEENIFEATKKAKEEVGASWQDVYLVLFGKPKGLPFSTMLKIQGFRKTIEYLKKYDI